MSQRCDNKSLYKIYLNNPHNKMFKFASFNNDNTSQSITKLKPSPSCGHDSISITHSSGIFVNKLIMAIVVPIYINNNKSLIKNYRPISIPPAI